MAAQPAPAPHLAHRDGCAVLHIVLVTVPRVSRSCEHLSGTDRKNQVNSHSHFFGRSENKESMTADDDSGPAWAVPDYMCEWLMSNKILDGIFLSNQHTEVIEKILV